MKSKRSHEGYLLIDNRHGPALTPEQAAKTGKDIAGVGNRSVFESATITCAHCHKIVVLNPQRTRERGYCSRCDHYVCDAPTCNAVCTPRSAILDEARKSELRKLRIILP